MPDARDSGTTREDGSVMDIYARRRIGAVIHEGHVRARTLPDDPALDDLRTDWGEVEYVPAEQLRGAVEDLEALRAVLSDVSAFPNRGARVQRAREMVVDLLNRLGGQ